MIQQTLPVTIRDIKFLNSFNELIVLLGTDYVTFTYELRYYTLFGRTARIKVTFSLSKL